VITNRLNLPQPIVEAIKNRTYSPGESDVTVTGLIDPVQITVLKQRHADEIVEDASDRIYSLQGESVHAILERAGKGLPNYIVEERFYYEYRGVKLGGQIDIYDKEHKILQDYKVTSVYSVRDGVKEEYAKQANINAFILRHNGYKVEGLQIVAILRDWRKMERERDVADSKARGYKPRYPEHQVVLLPVPMIDEDEVRAFIHERIDRHIEAKSLKDNELPPCSKEERWDTDYLFAVVELVKKKATRLFSSEEEAKLFIEDSKEHFIQKRPGINTRCANYCSVKSFCSQYNKNKGDK
jgi:hypothetical protein